MGKNGLKAIVVGDLESGSDGTIEHREHVTSRLLLGKFEIIF